MSTDDIFADLPPPKEPAVEESGGDSKQELTEEEKAGLPKWVQEPIVTLAFKEYKNGALIGTIPLGAKKQYVFGREASMVDVLLHHPTISRKQATLIHGTPPGTRGDHARSATLLDVGPGSTYYKKSRFHEKKHRLKKGKGVVLRANMCIIFAKSTRLYEVVGLDAVGSSVAPKNTEANRTAAALRLANASRQKDLASLNEAGKLRAGVKRTGETAFNGQANRNAEFEQRKKMREISVTKTAAILEKKAQAQASASSGSASSTASTS